MSLVVYVVHPRREMADAVRSQAKNVKVVYVQASENGDAEEEDLVKLQDAQVVFGSQFFLLKYRDRIPDLVWFHITAAGVNRLMKAIDEGKLKPDFRCTRNGGPHGETIKEYVIGHMIAHERHFAELQLAQGRQEWLQNQHMKQRPLFALTVGILGLGTVGEILAKGCKHFGMRVWGLKKDQPQEQKQFIDRYCVRENLPSLLASCDFVVSVLPSTPDTRDFLGGDILEYAKEKKPTLISVGRGDVISESSLLKALRCGWLGAAVLDVMPEEPLPPDSPLWTEPHVTITPHCASSSFNPLVFNKVAAFFMQNYVKFVRNEPLDCEVGWDRGY